MALVPVESKSYNEIRMYPHPDCATLDSQSLIPLNLGRTR